MDQDCNMNLLVCGVSEGLKEPGMHKALTIRQGGASVSHDYEGILSSLVPSRTDQRPPKLTYWFQDSTKCIGRRLMASLALIQF